MARTRSESLALAAALALACVEREIEVTPFAVNATVSGPALPLPVEGAALLTLAGTLTRLGDTSFRIEEQGGRTTVLAFSNAADARVVLPADLGGEGIVHLFAHASAVAPDGTRLPFPGFRVALGSPETGLYRFLLGESPFERGDGLARIPPPLGPENDPFSGDLSNLPIEDFPFFDVFADLARFEPAGCGIQYYDLLRAYGLGGDPRALREGEELQMTIFEGEAPWTVRHVLSWHRVGSCDEPATWTQLAAWR